MFNRSCRQYHVWLKRGRSIFFFQASESDRPPKGYEEVGVVEAPNRIKAVQIWLRQFEKEKVC